MKGHKFFCNIVVIGRRKKKEVKSNKINENVQYSVE